MSETENEMFDKIRDALARVTGRSFADLGQADALNLDSISRITLLVELEQGFQTELGADSVQPEDFETIASLKALIEREQ